MSGKIKEMSIMSKVDYLERRIYSSKQEAETLRQQISKLKTRMNDQGLIDVSNDVPSMPAKTNNLKSYTTLRGHHHKVACVRWNRDSRHVLSVSQDGFMIVWDGVTGLKTNAIILDSEWVLTGALSPNGRLAASAGLKNACVIYNVGQTTAMRTAPQREKNYVSGNRNNNYEMQPQPVYAGMQPIRTILKGHRCYISDCDFLDDSSILTASGDLTCVLWDVEKSSKKMEFTHHLGDVLCLSIQSQQYQLQRLFATGSSDGFAKIWDVRTPLPVQQFQVSQSDVTALKFFPDNGSIGVGSDDGTVRLFDLRADCKLSQYSLPAGLQQRHAKSRQQYNHIYSGESDSLLSKNLMSATGSISDAISVYSDIDTLGISSLDFSRSGRVLYVCYSDLGCFGWDLLKGEIIGELQGHSGRVNQVATSPDGMAICTASWDSTIKVWTS